MPLDGQRAWLRCLYLTHHSPWPTLSGGRVRDAQLVHHLTAYADLEVVAITRTPVSDAEALSDCHLPGLSVTLFEDESSPSPAPSRDSRAARHHLHRLMAEDAFDVIHVEGHYLVHLLPEDAANRTVLVEHNVESSLLDQRAALDGDAYLASLAGELRRQEQAAWRRCRYVVALSSSDGAAISMAAPDVDIRVIGNGWDHVAQRRPRTGTASNRIKAPRLLFFGNFAYSPNRDGLSWLLDEVFPRVRGQLGDAYLALAGANMDTLLLRKVANVRGIEVIGWVPDITTELDRADVVVCPLRIGGGMKVKTIEALRRGCALVSTSIGVQGLSPEQRAATLVADDAETFTEHVVRVCTDSQARTALATRMRHAQDAMQSWAASAESLRDLWTSIAGRARREAAG